MNTVLARLVLVFAFIPGAGQEDDAEALVLDDQATEPAQELERRLGRQLKSSIMQMLQTAEPVNGELIVNVSVGPDGSVRVVNAHGGEQAVDEAVEQGLDGAHT